MKAGSSPLARGLLGDRGDLFDDRGIIPARAGFTTRRSAATPSPPWIIPARAGFTNRPAPRRCTPWDHPRSRGVYVRSVRCRPRRSGSSPLARGLRAKASPDLIGAGIIPARAGFTEMAAETTDAISDHPRSRGVYVPEGTDPAARQGASLSVVAIPAGLPPGVVGTGGGHRGSPVPQPDSQGVHPRCPVTSLPCPR